MESHFLKAFDSELLSSKKTSTLWSGFHLGFTESEKVSWVTSFTISSLSFYPIVLWSFVYHHFLYSAFDGILLWSSILVSQKLPYHACSQNPLPILPCLLCYYALPPIVFLFCVSPLASPPSLCITFLSYPSLSSPLNSHPLIFRGLLDNWTKTFRVTLTSPVPCIVPGVVSTHKYLLNELIKCISFPFKPASFSNFHLLSLVSLFLSLSTTA